MHTENIGDQMESLVSQMVNHPLTFAESMREFKKRYIRCALKGNKGNVVRTARELGMHRNTLSRTIADLRLTEDAIQFRTGRRPARRVPGREAIRRIEQGA